jgi:hypothetical protein
MQSEDKENNADGTRVAVWKNCATQARVVEGK